MEGMLITFPKNSWNNWVCLAFRKDDWVWVQYHSPSIWKDVTKKKIKTGFLSFQSWQQINLIYRKANSNWMFACFFKKRQCFHLSLDLTNEQNLGKAAEIILDSLHTKREYPDFFMIFQANKKTFSNGK